MDKKKIFFGVRSLIFSYIITLGLLLILSFFLFKMNLSKEIVAAAVIFVYVISNFVGGMVLGKKVKDRKFLWGIGLGTAYFLSLILLTLFLNHTLKDGSSNFFLVYVLCAGSGMAGGMISS